MEPVKFLYAADLRLDKPLTLEGESGVLMPRARDAAYEAARRLVDCALSRAVDFVFIRGELCDAYCGARALLFLIEQTTRLSRAGIPCYILNEGAPLGSGRPAGFPPGVKWLNNADTVTCVNRTFSIAELTGYALMGEAAASCGAWLVSLPDAGKPEREFIELGAPLRERSEPDVPEPGTEDAAAHVPLKADFMEEAAFFKNSLDLRVSLLDVLKERGFLKRVLSGETGASMGAELLENMTEADVESLLRESCDMANCLLFSDGAASQ